LCQIVSNKRRDSDVRGALTIVDLRNGGAITARAWLNL
jgi:hypothetical protein